MPGPSSATFIMLLVILSEPDNKSCLLHLPSTGWQQPSVEPRLGCCSEYFLYSSFLPDFSDDVDKVYLFFFLLNMDIFSYVFRFGDGGGDVLIFHCLTFEW